MNTRVHTLPRHMQAELLDALQISRIVNLVGPRQVGKTTLVRDLYGGGEFLTLDNEVILSAIEADAAGLLASKRKSLGDAPLVIDEAQRSRSLALAIKRIVDEDRRRGQFLLTGSSNVFTAANVSDSLAGRVLTLKLWPLNIAEITGCAPSTILDWAMREIPELSDTPKPEVRTRDEYIDFILAGGYPDIRDLPLRARQRQYRSYIDTVVERDVADVFPIRKPDALRRLIDQMATRTSAEVSISSLAKDLGIQGVTVEQYLNVLTKLSVIIRLGHWASGEGSRDIRIAKYHFVDTGIACALRHFTPDTFDVSANPSALGGLLESFVFNELVRCLPFQNRDVRLYHWRSRDKREIDIVVDADTHIVGVEVKASATVRAEDFRHIKWFASKGPGCTRTVTGLVFYLGDQSLPFGDRCFALPVSSLWAA